MNNKFTNGDSIYHPILFDEKSLGKIIDGNLFKMRFTIKEDGELYSFKIDG